LLNATTERAIEIYALAEFQTVSSVGIKFADDLVFLDYYSPSALVRIPTNQLSFSRKDKKGQDFAFYFLYFITKK
jgi:hypothetical protein